jgi:chromosome segregation ATPase
MNKRHFLALIATLFITLGAFAQGNTYNMVLTLADETKIIIGPNDLTKLEFVEGNLTTEGGTNIIELMNQMKALQASIVAVQADVANTQKSVAAAKAELQADILSSQKQIDALNASIKESQTSIAALNNSVASSQIQIENLQSGMKDMHDSMEANKNLLMAYTDKEIEESKAEILALINALQTIIEQNTANIEKNTADIAGNKASIATNTAGIDTNKKAIIELVKKLRDAGIRI